MICALFGVVFFGLGLHKIEHQPLSGSPLKFSGPKSHASMTALSKGFPNRVTWSDSRRKAGAWIKNEFVRMGYSPKSMYFSETVAGKHYTDLENIYVEKRGSRHPDEIIVAMGHYDITDTTVEGAMDDASGTAVMLELARVFAGESPDRTLIFIATDSEEFGAFWGARAFAKNFDRSRQIVAAANFDFVAPEKQVKILTLCDGLKDGYTPLWLRELALDSIASIDESLVLDFTNFMEHIERSLEIPAADHGPFLAEGIPAFNWTGQTANFAHEMAHYHHTPSDVAEAMRPESFDVYGRAAERLIRSVDELPTIPSDFRNSSYWKVSKGFYIDGWAVTVLHILAFIPFFIYSLTKFGFVLETESRGRVWVIFKNEAKNMGIILGSLLLGYTLLLLLPALKIITQYEIFPATQKSLILSSPNFLAMLLVLTAVAGVYFVFKRTFTEADDSLDYFQIRHALHAAFIAVIIFLAFLKNSYLGVLLLLPPAYAWTALRNRKSRADRLINLLLLLSGGITLIAMTFVLSTIFHLGIIYWYLFLSAAYGLISAYSVVLFLMALTVMIRLFRSFVL